MLGSAAGGGGAVVRCPARAGDAELLTDMLLAVVVGAGQPRSDDTLVCTNLPVGHRPSSSALPPMKMISAAITFRRSCRSLAGPVLIGPQPLGGEPIQTGWESAEVRYPPRGRNQGHRGVSRLPASGGRPSSAVADHGVAHAEPVPAWVTSSMVTFTVPACSPIVRRSSVMTTSCTRRTMLCGRWP